MSAILTSKNARNMVFGVWHWSLNVDMNVTKGFWPSLTWSNPTSDFFCQLSQPLLKQDTLLILKYLSVSNKFSLSSLNLILVASLACLEFIIHTCYPTLIIAKSIVAESKKHFPIPQDKCDQNSAFWTRCVEQIIPHSKYTFYKVKENYGFLSCSYIVVVIK